MYHPEKSSYFSIGQVTHYNVTTGQVTHYNVTNMKNPRIFHWVGNPLQCDHPEKLSYFSIIGAGRLEQLDHL